MFEPHDGPRVFGVAPGADFPAELARGLRERVAGLPPEALARCEVLVNTARMQERLRAALMAQGPGFLPRLRLIGQVAGGETDAPLRTRLELAQLIRQLLQAEPDLGPTSAAFSLAESLFRLLDEMQGEAVTLDILDQLDVSQHSLHWDRSLRFIRLIARFLGPASGGQAQLRAAVERLTAQWAETPPTHPLIIAGSTGSRGPTALLMQAVARLPQGALVLPGFDFALPGPVWRSLDDPLQSEDHPQFRYAHLMEGVGAEPRVVQPWTQASAPDPARNALVSLALRPAPVTDQWLRDGPGLGDLSGPTAALSLIEAATPRQEALAIALCLRDAAVQGQKAALITPDRTLARRVTAALDRWHLRPDDSAGRPLSLSAPGRFLRQSVELLTRPVTAEALIALLKHPIAHSATERGPHLLHLRDLELYLRRKAIPFPDRTALAGFAARDEARKAWAEWLTGALDALPGEGERPLADWVAAHAALIAHLAAGAGGKGTGELWKEAAGEAALALFDDLTEHAVFGGEMLGSDYSALLETLFVGREVREVLESHPQVMIWGTLEARAQGADLVIMGGLTEGTWPSAPSPDPWFNRRMRLDAGLLLPERAIGLSAHDFQQAVCAPRVVLSRARRNAEAETVPSRWLNRLTNLIGGLKAQGGDVALAAMRDRGAQWLTLADALEADLRAVPAASAARSPRPAPAPPAQARLNELPVTRIEKLIRDPYHIYAERILRLGKLNPLAPQADARLRGTVLHKVPDDYVKAHPPGTPADLDAFFAIAETVLAEHCPWVATRLHWRARLERTARDFVEWNASLGGEPVLREERGAIILANPPFKLTGQPDRIDRLPDGSLQIYDYKTGSLPSKKQIEFFNIQLVLLAMMAGDDAFGLGPAEVTLAEFVGLGSAFKRQESPSDPGTVAEHRAKLLDLITTYRDPEQGFTALRAVEMETHYGDYDALSRRGEWEVTDKPVTIRVGQSDG
ncbi:double-strand break repair protein AddB [Pararhodobacter zhoushanensis]|uniref:double-strand break repair protein AddB n=1 Tax=Pararhodobacter zhoushanensis TaxID=2479545 RepID=UPI000F8ED4B9|nr:double-strand break repair protein AddB [Pararhodobacter zhoushanensis]